MKPSRLQQHDRVQIRVARPADVPGIYKLEEISFAVAGERFNRRQVDYLVRRAKGVMLVAESAGAVLGWAAGLVRRSAAGKRGARVYALAVHPDARGLRIGHRLLTRLLRELRRKRVGAVWLEVRAENTAAIELYRKHGFAEDRGLHHYYGRKVHGLRMVRELGG